PRGYRREGPGAGAHHPGQLRDINIPTRNTTPLFPSSSCNPPQRPAYDGGGAGKGGKATLCVNGQSVAEGRVEKPQPNIFSADETADVGIDNQTPVAEGIGIGPETRFTGTINKITLEVGPAKN